MSDRLSGAVVVLTGADSGLGIAFARRLISAGAYIAMICRAAARPPLERVVDEQGWKGNAEVFAFDGDLTSAAQGLIDRVFSRYGRLDVLINNAGLRYKKRFREVTPTDWADMMAVNLRDPYFLSQAFCSHPGRNGAKAAIVNIASHLGIVGHLDYSLYTVSKGGLISMTKALAIELAREGVTVNAVAPGPTNTIKANLLQTDDDVIDFLQRMPISRRVEQSEVADAVAYLAGLAGGAVTGHTLVVDGGWTIW